MLRHNKRVVGVICGLALSIESMQASGFRLTEQSLNGTALNSAFIAGAYGADSTYYNPANMSLGRDSDKHEIEIDGTLLFIPPFRFSTGDRSVYECASQNICNKSVEGKALTTIQPIPKFFYKSRAYEVASSLRTNFGVSFTTPSGLSMNWDGIGGGFLDDVSIAMMELNPVVSLAWRDFISFGVGFRAIYSFGSFNNTLYVPYNAIGGAFKGTTKVEQTSNAKGFGFGYNLALSIKPFATSSVEPLKSLTLSSTYRSKVGIDMNGSLSALAHVSQSGANMGTVNMDAGLMLNADMPHILNVGISQDFGRSRVEFVYERTFWGSARIFDFQYANQRFYNLTGALAFLGVDYVAGMMNSADYSAVAYGNGWKDSNAYRLGYTYFGESYKIMGSIAYDETPAPQGKFGIPDANAYMFGLGFRKRFLDDRLDLGLAYSLALKDNRKSFIVSHDGFGQLHLLTIGAKYLW